MIDFPGFEQQCNWSKAALVLDGYNATRGKPGPPRVVLLDDSPASQQPQSQLLFGPAW